MEVNYNIMVGFAIHWHESATGVQSCTHVQPQVFLVWNKAVPNCPPTYLPILPLWIVPVHQFWVPFQASNLDWSSISHTVIYMFQCYSLKSSHSRLLPESKSLYFISVSLPSCIEGHCYHLSKFYHIYALIYCYWCFSFWLTSLCIIGSSFIHLIKTNSNMFFLYLVIFHYEYVTQLSYPFIFRQTSRLLPCPSYC